MVSQNKLTASGFLWRKADKRLIILVMGQRMDLDGFADKAKGHIHDFFGCVPNLGHNKNPYSNESDF